MNKTTLVIMAAGIGSRYGGGIKQLEHVGPSGEIIMDYSIFDAIEAGFNKVIFIIRKDIEKDFREIIGNRIQKHVEVEYVFQELDALPAGFHKPEERKKPWGTGQAVLCCKNAIHEPFAVINADDYYGKEAFVKVHDFLCNASVETEKGQYCMAGFVLGNTLSDNGIVTRGVCKVDENSYLSNIEETFEIERQGDKAVGKDKSGRPMTIALESSVSMNIWGFVPDILNELEEEFVAFLKGIKEDDVKSEYLLPEVVGTMLREGRASVKVLKTNDKWFGVTYKEDKELVVSSIRELIAQGKYPSCIFQD